ncbi:MAG: bifunctional pyr operon transcriptional regulator/uracil phosphoribosyltransferase PyrR [Bacteroidetes bacterium]|nr:MAG: bifunctional pyr operon transcriptional regulator/uracil phosphoribosyltransferase PyrR [Bacteroidota bacterium]
MNENVILDPVHFNLTIKRLCFELIENHDDFSQSVIIGLQPRGVFLANHIKKELENIIPGIQLKVGKLDITFYRDDFRRRDTPITANETEMNFVIENKKVIMVDDVFYTGRSLRSGLDAMLAFGRPQKVEMLVLIERKYSRDYPLQPDYIGKSVDSLSSQRVKVYWEETEKKNLVKLYTIK